ncbi:hypothetical protein PAXRUDRAFT_825396 [Paxillus rubicundulus Ve08.2h10]|uniref:BCAS3 WD40 domain-containing protein n=1 Tax=Paxillus rubicundulus Ve08.2h10 TaxID=930991 RepID=A0A0D0DTA8_9AGAM|nr:hypothetical protein PAXRUDRAFT_825396 [Paxillus rubicundulus Ve08.2h10]
MRSKKTRNAQRQSSPELVTYYRPLLQLHNSPSWPAEQPALLQLDRPPGADSDSDVQLDLEHEVVQEQKDWGPPTPSLHPVDLKMLSPQLSQGHTRSPVLARQPTMLENFSRTVRNYVPTSIPVPTAAPTPPRVSRPVSFGSFMGVNLGSLNSPAMGRNISDRHRRHATESLPSSRAKEALDGEDFGSEDEGAPPENLRLTAYPTVSEGDTILWSRWDTLTQHNSKPRRVLFLGYPSGFQMWDCTNLASISEVLNLHGPSWEHATFAGALPPPPVADDDQLTSLRPLIGAISKIRGQSFMVIYSLRSHEVVKRLPFHNVSSFASSNDFTIICTTNPPTLHVLSSASFTILHTISSSSIFAYSRTSTHKPNTISPVLLTDIDPHLFEDDASAPGDPVPIYSLSHRLLAFASRPPPSDSPHASAALQPRTHVRASSSTFGISQADLGSAAIKVGGTVLSGMKSLGGMAYNAAAEYARSRSSIAPLTPPSPRVREETTRGLSGAKEDQPPSVISGVSNLFFSRSAPAASGAHGQGHGRGHPNLRGATSTSPRDASPSSDAGNAAEFWLTPKPASGSYVKVLDLAPLMNYQASSHPQVVTEFVAAKHQTISNLQFTHDGNSLLVGPKDGQVVRVFQIRPRPGVLRAGHGGGGAAAGSSSRGADVKGRKSAGAGLGSVHPPPPPRPEDDVCDAPWHVYNLRRGRTSAVIEGMEISLDGRWVAIVTGKRTVHMFAINPYGGQPDLRSHTDTRIWNADKPQPLSTELSPMARLRSARATGAEGLHWNLSFTFVSGEAALPNSLLPPPSQIASSPSASSGRSDLPSPHPSHRQQNFKDVLLFDPSGGVLSLRRITLEQRSRESAIPFSSPIANFATSVSLPGVGAAGRLSASPPSHAPKDSRKGSGLTQQLSEAATELVGKESIVATWQLKRRQDWGEVKNVVSETGDGVRSTVSNSLAHAELSTCSRAPEIVPRSIYLSHQFLFFSLGEDYHALIRRHHLDMMGDKIEVRKEVEASADATAPGELFVEGFSAGTRDHFGRAASSFDAPIASAMSADLEYTFSARSPVIPMLPNGTAGSKPRSFGSSIPIRHVTAGIAEGVGEGFGRIRRGVHRVRSPQLGDGGFAAPVPLEFDEHDEDFGEAPRGGGGGGGVHPSETRAPSRRTSTGAADSSASLSTPSTQVNPLEDGGEGDDLWHGWNDEDKLAVDEAEQFDDVVGFMDEDQTPAIRAEQRKSNRRQAW